MTEHVSEFPTLTDAPESLRVSVGEAIVRLLEHWGVSHVFGVISIHNMPILDPLGVRGRIRYISARGEAGALNMADAFARVSGGLGVAFTSTGTAAGNAAGGMVEAITAGSPVLHITGQVELEHLDRDRAYIHEAPRQLDMLRAVSKAAWRILSPEEVVPVMLEAAQAALSAPTGPVSIEIPVDVQAALTDLPPVLPDLSPVRPQVSEAQARALADRLRAARRPMMLLGGGARGAEAEALRLADMGVAVVTSTNGRGVVPEDHPLSLGAFNCTPQIQALYDDCDLLIVAGSRLRGNETWIYKLRLPDNTVVIDADASADGRTYDNSLFIAADVRATLGAVLNLIGDGLSTAAEFPGDVARARAEMHEELRKGLGPYDRLVDALQAAVTPQTAWVRDVTISNSMWGNRYLRIGHSRAGVHAVGGGIGQGLPMAIGAAMAAPDGVLALTGDGGLNLCLGELATLADEKAPVVLILMNDAGYGVIRNIQDAEYGGRRYFTDIQVPDFALISEALGLPHERVGDLDDFPAALERARTRLRTGEGATVIEIDMLRTGHYPARFAGPPRLKAGK